MYSVGPNYINGYIKGNKAICEARGNPKPELKLKHSTIGKFSHLFQICFIPIFNFNHYLKIMFSSLWKDDVE